MVDTRVCASSVELFKVTLGSNFRYTFLYIFVHFCTQQVFPGHLAKFRSIRKYRTHVFWTFVSVNLRTPLFSLFQFLVENWRKWCHLLKNTGQVEIIITKSAENCMNTGATVFVLLRANRCTNCYKYNFNPCGIFENMTSFTPVNIGTRKINGSAKFSEIKVQNHTL